MPVLGINIFTWLSCVRQGKGETMEGTNPFAFGVTNAASLVALLPEDQQVRIKQVYGDVFEDPLALDMFVEDFVRIIELLREPLIECKNSATAGLLREWEDVASKNDLDQRVYNGIRNTIRYQNTRLINSVLRVLGVSQLVGLSRVTNGN